MFSFNHNLRPKVSPSEKHMPIVKCLCGKEILVVPDLKAMNQAIRNLVSEHRKAKDKSKISGYLAGQILIAASKINFDN
jgi:hypothetical protein